MTEKYPFELRFLIACCQVNPTEDEICRIKTSLSSFDSVSDILGMSFRHGVFPLVYNTLKNLLINEGDKSLAVNLKLLEEMKSHYMDFVQKNMLMSSELIKIMELFKKNNIKALAFKGPVLSQESYGNIIFRQYGDLDILVSEEQLAKAGELLISQGYNSSFPLKVLENQICLSVTNDLGFRHPSKSILIELHWRLFREKIAEHLQFSEIFNDKREILINGKNVPTLSVEMLLVYLCLHGSKHAWERLEWICDIDRLVRNQEVIDWKKVNLIAVKMKTTTTLYLGLSLANNLFHTPIPDSMTSAVKKQKIDFLVDKTLKLLGGTLPQELSYVRYSVIHRYQMDLFETKREKIRHIVATYFSISQNDCLEFPLPKFLKVLYIAIKPIRVINKYLRYGR